MFMLFSRVAKDRPSTVSDRGETSAIRGMEPASIQPTSQQRSRTGENSWEGLPRQTDVRLRSMPKEGTDRNG